MKIITRIEIDRPILEIFHSLFSGMDQYISEQIAQSVNTYACRLIEEIIFVIIVFQQFGSRGGNLP